jgi:hypothetical protein
VCRPSIIGSRRHYDWLEKNRSESQKKRKKEKNDENMLRKKNVGKKRSLKKKTNERLYPSLKYVWTERFGVGIF